MVRMGRGYLGGVLRQGGIFSAKGFRAVLQEVCVCVCVRLPMHVCVSGYIHACM